MQKKYFNVAGPCNISEHYMLDPLRDSGEELMDLINTRQYFVIHAARQSGKTTLLFNIADKLIAEGKFYVLYCSLESMQNLKEESIGIPSVVKKIKQELRLQKLPGGFADNADYEDFANVLKVTLTDYCGSLDKPFVLLFDEAD